MNALEKNKLIAEFMGWTLDDKDLNSYRKLNNNVFKYSLLSNFKYDTDWNWLIAVVEKIANMKGFYAIENDLKDTIINAKIDAVYNACVEFIKWYNENRLIKDDALR
jgi:hypothetical protein